MSYSPFPIVFTRPSRACVLLAGLALALVAGCDRAGSTGATTQASANGAAKPLSVGFSQIGAESAWRTANTQSIQDEAKKRGIDLKLADAQQKQENQIKAIRTFISQGVDVIAFSPVVETGWEPVLREAKDAGIPVILSDRAITTSDPSLFRGQIGFDSIAEGRAAGDFAVQATGGKAMIAELQGTPGAAPAIDRAKGFRDAIAGHPDMHIIKSQTGDFTRAKGREVMEAFLNSPEGDQITLVFAHNDDMALGAIQAIQAKGKKPGVDIKVVSIDGVRDAFQAMVDGTLNCTVECNPMIGPQLFDLLEKVHKGESIPSKTIVPPHVFTQSDAAAALPSRKY